MRNASQLYAKQPNVGLQAGHAAKKKSAIRGWNVRVDCVSYRNVVSRASSVAKVSIPVLNVLISSMLAA